ncbi:MAG: hypothetical protein BroJett011_70920 [Chloroflexota bacterium]|nr:MAG: hypothetical protein BroJett011_70920 [Chloroflexota bacterium]
MKDGQGFARRVTGENLERFAPLLRRKIESDSAESTGSKITEEKIPPDPELKVAEALFSGNPIKISIPSRFSGRRRVIKKRSYSPISKRRSKKIATPVQAINQGQLIWEKKKLRPTDAQRQQGAVTGGLRLTQANFEADGKIIDQTTYFRNTVFGKLNWSIGIYKPKKREAVLANFIVRILGKDYGLWNLIVSHKPSGEAGQGNYTTILHWGGLASTIKELDLVGKTFRLYAPPENQQEPFFIEIV